MPAQVSRTKSHSGRTTCQVSLFKSFWRKHLYHGEPTLQSHRQKQGKPWSSCLSDTSILLHLDNQLLKWAREAEAISKKMKRWKGRRESSPASPGSTGKPTLLPPTSVGCNSPNCRAAPQSLHPEQSLSPPAPPPAHRGFYPSLRTHPKNMILW